MIVEIGDWVLEKGCKQLERWHQSFTRGLPNDFSDMAPTKTIIEIGTGLGMEVIAEGVETEEQAEFLMSEGCNHAKGYFYGKPMPANEFEKFWKAWANDRGNA